MASATNSFMCTPACWRTMRSKVRGRLFCRREATIACNGVDIGGAWRLGRASAQTYPVSAGAVLRLERFNNDRAIFELTFGQGFRILRPCRVLAVLRQSSTAGMPVGRSIQG